MHREVAASRCRIVQLENCDRSMFGTLLLRPLADQPPAERFTLTRHHSLQPVASGGRLEEEKRRRASDLVDELLFDIYKKGAPCSRPPTPCKVPLDFRQLNAKDVKQLVQLVAALERHVERTGGTLVRRLKRRDALRRQQHAHCDVISGQLVKRCGPEEPINFTIQPSAGENGFQQWANAMKMVAHLPSGIPAEFRRRLWLTLAERHLHSRRIDWPHVEKECFSEWSHPADSELGVQIVKDLHRTGCSLFCGEDGLENQALLKRVLLAYARWNKAVGYCQGFNMLAALILQVTDKSESDTLKVMIYLIEGVLPDSYFADSLRGLSIDMAVFRELLRAKLPRLSHHLDTLQNASKEGTTSYEPPLTNVFTMQWFLTLFCNCLPHTTVLRVWDLIMLEGNEILLRTALAIWQTLAERISAVKSADEFYCLMGLLTRKLLEFDLIDGNALIKAIVTIGPLYELKSLREHYLYNINPWGGATATSTITQQRHKQVKVYPKERLMLDIGALKHQYVKLKQRQRQAHIIFSAAISRQPAASAPVAMNHLLLGKSALVPAKRLAPAKAGSIPPARHLAPSTLHWKDAPKCDSSSSSDTELCDDEDEADSSSDSDACQLPNDNPDGATGQISDLLSFAKAPASEDEDEFETFLQDRVSFLKTKEEAVEVEEVEKSVVTTPRRNSERALQIIKENSLILHRIMQCQSRLSPPIGDEGKKSPIEEVKEYGSMYSSLLEKSRNLDERFNTLIVNAGVPQSAQSKVDVGGGSEAFSPFPVALTSRQNKDVPVKLGLYKK